jgi:hypothetical protein
MSEVDVHSAAMGGGDALTNHDDAHRGCAHPSPIFLAGKAILSLNHVQTDLCRLETRLGLESHVLHVLSCAAL